MSSPPCNCLQKHSAIPETSNPARIVWNYAKADFCKARYLIDHTDWKSVMSEDVNASLVKWQTAFISIMQRCIPKAVLRPRKNLPWLTKQLIQATKKKKVLFQKARRTGHGTDYESYKRFRTKLTSKQKYLKGLRSFDQKKFWKAVKNINQRKTSIPTLSEDGTNASSNYEKAI
jgi:hypothetical protein